MWARRARGNGLGPLRCTVLAGAIYATAAQVEDVDRSSRKFILYSLRCGMDRPGVGSSPLGFRLPNSKTETKALGLVRGRVCQMNCGLRMWRVGLSGFDVPEAFSVCFGGVPGLAALVKVFLPGAAKVWSSVGQHAPLAAECITQ